MTTRAMGQLKVDESLLNKTAYDVIKRDLICCVLTPGQQVSEQQIAARYGIGRAAARGALHRLRLEKLVTVEPRHGYRITPVTIKEVHDLFATRLLLEPATARLAAGHLDPAALLRLQELMEVHSRPGDRASVEATVRASTEFHLIIARASGNTTVEHIIANLFDLMERVQFLSMLLLDNNEEDTEEHRALFDALAAGDGPRAEQLTIDHLWSAKRFTLEALLLSPSVQAVNITYA